MDRSVYHRLEKIETEHWWFRARRNILRSVVSRYTPRATGLRILEAGCGTGGNLGMLAEFGELHAFELDEEARQAAIRKHPIDIKFGSLPNNVPYPANSFDIVAALDVIEHIEDDVGSLQKLRQLLSADGRLIISVPALSWLWSEHDVSHHHFRRYTRSQLKSVLHEAGLKPIVLTYFNTLLFPAIAVQRLTKRALGRQWQGDDTMPSPFVNRVLNHIFETEKYLIGRIPMPVGVSLLAVAEKLR